jgi:hypothetical protein
MYSREFYHSYKRNTSYVLFWTVEVYNEILKNGTATDLDIGLQKFTGQVNVSNLLVMARVISENVNTIPSAVFGLFYAVIKARKEACAAFEQISAHDADVDLEVSNATHRHFVDVLEESFRVLGGEEWLEQEADRIADRDQYYYATEVERTIFTNRFSLLKPSCTSTPNSSDTEPEDDPMNAKPARPRRQNKAFKRKKKGKSGNKGKSKNKNPREDATAIRPRDEDLLKNYCFLDDDDDRLMSVNYIIASFFIANEWIDARADVQARWKETMYRGANTIIPAAVSHTAVAMVKQAESEIFVDHPGGDSFVSLMTSFIQTEMSNRHPAVPTEHKENTMNEQERTAATTLATLKEPLMIPTYEDLRDFVIDYHKNFNGKPSKKMLAQIKDWEPDVDPRKLTTLARFRWRRSYVINWLYDLVNVYKDITDKVSEVLGPDLSLNQAKIRTEDSPWFRIPRFFGLHEFAHFVTSLALEDRGKEFKHKILPHHVFQLQCIVDSLTMSRGWNPCREILKVTAEPPASFQPNRDVDTYLNGDPTRNTWGLKKSVKKIIETILDDYSPDMDIGGLTRNCVRYLKMTSYYLEEWVGRSPYAKGGSIRGTQSRFSHCNSNGLWEYSPLLCGTGLLEAIELVHRVSMLTWDQAIEPSTLFRLFHGARTRLPEMPAKGLDVLWGLRQLFPGSFYKICPHVESSDEHKVCWIPRAFDHPQCFSRRKPKRIQRSRHYPDPGRDICDSINPHANNYMLRRLVILDFQEAGWDVNRISDNLSNTTSILGVLRKTACKKIGRISDSDSGREGVLAYLDFNFSYRALLAKMENQERGDAVKTHAKELSKPSREEAYGKFTEKLDQVFERYSGVKTDWGLSPREMLEVVRWDVTIEFNEPRPIIIVDLLRLLWEFCEVISRINQRLSKLDAIQVTGTKKIVHSAELTAFRDNRGVRYGVIMVPEQEESTTWEQELDFLRTPLAKFYHWPIESSHQSCPSEGFGCPVCDSKKDFENWGKATLSATAQHKEVGMTKVEELDTQYKIMNLISNMKVAPEEKTPYNSKAGKNIGRKGNKKNNRK